MTERDIKEAAVEYIGVRNSGYTLDQFRMEVKAFTAGAKWVIDKMLEEKFTLPQRVLSKEQCKSCGDMKVLCLHGQCSSCECNNHCWVTD